MKNFMKAHYEKVILAFLLVLFAGMLYYQVTVVQEVQNKKVDDIINQKDIPSDYKQIDFAGGKAYRMETIFSDQLALDFTVNSSAVNTAEMMAPYSLAECVYCHSLIPSASYPAIGQTKNGKCPVCGKALAPRVKQEEDYLAGKADLNLNSIPDEWENQYGLHDENTMANSDQDVDGFTLIQEYKAKTDPTDPLSHPKYVTVIYVSAIREQTIRGLELTAVDTRSKEPKDWTATFNVVRDNRKRTEFVKNLRQGTFKNYNVDYNIVEIVIDEKTTDPIVYIQRIGRPDERIECRLKQSVKDPSPRVTFYNSLYKRSITSSVGNTFKLGTAKTGEEIYKIVSADSAKRQAVVESTKDEKPVTYTIQPVPEGMISNGGAPVRTGAGGADSFLNPIR